MRTAWATLAVFTLINGVNYADRYVLAGLLPLVQGEFQKTDAQMGVLSASFLLVFSIASPLLGFAGDRLSRKRLISAGVLVWSLATVWSAHARSYEELLVARAVIGIGEAAYGAAAPSFLADLFTAQRRGQMLAVFYAAIPVGVGVGYAIGGAVGAAYGWRAAFLVAGVPGFVLALLALVPREPERGAMDEARGPGRASVADIARALASSRSFVVNTVGATAMSFAVGGVGAWMPTFLHRVRGVPLDRGGMIFGGLLIVAGFTGTLAGGAFGKRASSYLSFSGTALLIAAPLSLLAVALPQPFLYWPLLFAALFCLFLNTGPLGAALVNAVPATMRATAVAVNVFAIHVLGDAVSPFLVGAVSDRSSLTTGLLCVSAMLGFAGLVLMFGEGLTLPRAREPA